MQHPPLKSLGSPDLFFELEGFSAAVAGIARAADQIAAAERQVNHAAGSTDDFGAVGPAWSKFHHAWSARAGLAASGADQLTSLVRVTGHALQSADLASDSGSGTIDAKSIWSGGPDGAGQNSSLPASALSPGTSYLPGISVAPG